MPYPVSLTFISVYETSFLVVWHKLRVTRPCSVYLMALDIRLSSIIVMISLSKNRSISSFSVWIRKSIFGFWFSSLYLNPISWISGVRLPLQTHSFLFCVSVFLNSRIWLIRFSKRRALWWITDNFCACFVGREVSFCMSSRGPRINVSGVRNSCVMLV